MTSRVNRRHRLLVENCCCIALAGSACCVLLKTLLPDANNGLGRQVPFALDRVVQPALEPALHTVPVSRLPPLPPGPIASAATTIRRSDIRRSDLSPWMQFVYDNPSIALTAEMELSTVLQQFVTPEARRSRHCNVPNEKKLAMLSAHIRIAGSKLETREWACALPDLSRASLEDCECYIGLVPANVDVEIPGVGSRAVALFEGVIELRVSF